MQSREEKAAYSKLYHESHRQEIGERHRMYRLQHRLELAAKQRARANTLEGYLRHLYHAMRRRCLNSQQHDYCYYGGRGIRCNFETPDDFIKYVTDVLKVDPRGLTIDRIDNNGHYEKGNIRFVTLSDNCKNRRKRRVA